MRPAIARLASLCPGVLRPSDQAVVAAGTLVCALAMGATWLASGGVSGHWVEPGDYPRQSAEFRLDVNTASAAELDLLPNIGATRAQQIIRERQRGAFVSPEDLAHRIKGIGDKTVAKMKPYLLPMTEPARTAITSHPAAPPLGGSPLAAVPLASATTRPPTAAFPPGRTSE